jgi:hypothetical protein
VLVQSMCLWEQSGNRVSTSFWIFGNVTLLRWISSSDCLSPKRHFVFAQMVVVLWDCGKINGILSTRGWSGTSE